MLVSILLLSFSPPAFANQTIEKVLIVFEDKIDASIVQQVNGEITHLYGQFHALSAEVPSSSIPYLKESKGIVAVEEDTLVANQVQFQDWGIDALDVPKSWNSSFTGRGVKIAVLDTGIASHPDLEIAGGKAFVHYTTSYYDDNGHGTHVAGIIGAKNNNLGTVGVAPDASLYAVKVLDNNGEGYVSDIVAGIDWSIQNKIDIINMSLSTIEHSFLLKTAVDTAYKNGILVVAAAGNNGTPDGSSDTVEYPARYQSVIAVSAVDSSFQRGSFSASGLNVEVTAPGVGITSTYLKNDYARLNGTSMATPYVTGILALMKNAYPTLSQTSLREQLHQSAIDLGTPGKDSFYGYGLVQAPLEEKITERPEEPIFKTGWQYDNGSWFYGDSTGEFVKGWLVEEERWYYFDQTGAMVTGWLYDHGTWYFLSGDGAMKTGWLYDDRSWYFLAKSGAMETGWVLDNNRWYYFGSNGAMKTGWVFDNKAWYFLSNNGSMKTGWLFKNGGWYFLAKNGAMKTGWFQDLDNTWYYLDNNGLMVTGWVLIQNNWYFMNSTGAMVSGWKQINGSWYYFYPSGKMASNTSVGGYRLGYNGVWIQ
ncbi:hypothetical protein DZB84_10450 [Bacillus sp. HNG]|uniref:S8 family serine peptidase n=1 Tax=Bacillus sp. HNG TaxID=2293325 RepID=UPI000E2F0D00|nr:S8 family serine peptidase [Bacillus sp. HNG]RFB17473.1 hypothetical protein DZB84_10450 [Bacillus sp. HNG]